MQTTNCMQISWCSAYMTHALRYPFNFDYYICDRTYICINPWHHFLWNDFACRQTFAANEYQIFPIILEILSNLFTRRQFPAMVKLHIWNLLKFIVDIWRNAHKWHLYWHHALKVTVRCCWVKPWSHRTPRLNHVQEVMKIWWTWS